MNEDDRDRILHSLNPFGRGPTHFDRQGEALTLWQWSQHYEDALYRQVCATVVFSETSPNRWCEVSTIWEGTWDFTINRMFDTQVRWVASGREINEYVQDSTERAAVKRHAQAALDALADMPSDAEMVPVFPACNVWQAELVRLVDLRTRGEQYSSITCPTCDMTSYSPMDISTGYCGNCHEFTGAPQ